MALPACSGGGTSSPQIPTTSQIGQDSTSNAAVRQNTSASSRKTFDQAAGNGTMTSEQPYQADTFVDSIGVDTKFAYNHSAYVLQWPAYSTALINSGFRHIRDGDNPTPGYLAKLAFLAQHGIKHSAFFPINVTPGQIDSILNAYGVQNVDYVEPANEYDGFWQTDPQWPEHIAAEQKVIYPAMRSNPAYANIAVLGPSLSNRTYYSKLGDLDGYEDSSNMHYSTCALNPGTVVPPWDLPDQTALVKTAAPTKPVATTETGFGDDMKLSCSIPDDVTAKYDPRTVAERFNLGERHIYFYEFGDYPANHAFDSFGLIRTDGSLKPQYVTLKSMFYTVANKGPSFSPTPLTYSLSGATSNVHHTLLQKRDGTYIMLLWIETRSWDEIRRRRITVPSQNVTLTLQNQPTFAAVRTYTPNFGLQTTSLPLTKTQNLTLTDSISFVEFR